MTARRFMLRRRVDVSGVSGIGDVAEGILWSDGTATLRWQMPLPSTTHYDQGMRAVEAVHGHGGTTVVKWIDGPGIAGRNDTRAAPHGSGTTIRPCHSTRQWTPQPTIPTSTTTWTDRTTSQTATADEPPPRTRPVPGAVWFGHNIVAHHEGDKATAEAFHAAMLRRTTRRDVQALIRTYRTATIAARALTDALQTAEIGTDDIDVIATLTDHARPLVLLILTDTSAPPDRTRHQPQRTDAGGGGPPQHEEPSAGRAA